MPLREGESSSSWLSSFDLLFGSVTLLLSPYLGFGPFYVGLVSCPLRNYGRILLGRQGTDDIDLLYILRTGDTAGSTSS